MAACGLLSGLVPVINAEALLVAAVLAGDGRWWPPLAVAVALGQSGAKVLIFLGARDREQLMTHVRGRRGTRWLPVRGPAWARATSRRRARWLPVDPARVAELVRRPVAGSLLVLVSAVGGVPPLAATSVVAGVARMPLALFGATCVTGRLVRFTLVALPVAVHPGVS
jgi:membrane protein YqaA with SNARE-associated domain